MPSQSTKLNAPIIVEDDPPIVIRDFTEPPAKCVRISNNKIIQTSTKTWPIKRIVQNPKTQSLNFKQPFDTNIINEKFNTHTKNVKVNRKSTNFVPLAPKPPNFNSK